MLIVAYSHGPRSIFDGSRGGGGGTRLIVVYSHGPRSIFDGSSGGGGGASWMVDSEILAFLAMLDSCGSGGIRRRSGIHGKWT